MRERHGRRGASPASLAAALLVSACVLARADPPPLLLQARPAPGGVLLRASVPAGAAAEAERRETYEALTRGLRAEIVFQLRVYAISRGPFAFLGDRLLCESTVSRTARWDPFSERFVVTEEEGGEELPPLAEAKDESILDAFFAMERIVPFRLEAGAAAYVAGRYRYSPVKLDGILALVRLWSGQGTRTSAWSRLELGASS